MSDQNNIPTPPLPPPSSTPPTPTYYGQSPQPASGQTSSLPLLALIFGIGGFFFSFISSIPAIILGVMGRKKAKELNEPTSMATAGLVLGIISTALSVLSIILLVFMIGFATTNISSGTMTNTTSSVKAQNNVAAIANVVKNGQGVGDTVFVNGTTVSYSGDTGQQTIDLGTATINNTIITMDSTWCLQDTGGGETWIMTQDDIAPQLGGC